MDRRFCPFIARKCVGDACMLWGIESFRETLTGTERTEPGCLIVFQYQISRHGVVEQIRTQAGIDKVATELTEAGDRVLQAVAIGAARRALPHEADHADGHG